MDASSHGDGGPRGRICRDAPAWLNDGTPPGTEVSSGPSNTRRSWGRGVEEANGITRVRTPGNPAVRSIHTDPLFTAAGFLGRFATCGNCVVASPPRHIVAGRRPATRPPLQTRGEKLP